MKTLFNHAKLVGFKLKPTLFAILSLLTVALIGCKKDDDAAPTLPAISYVSLYHASPDAPPINIFLDNQRVNFNPVQYAGFTSYLNFYSGTRNLRVRQVNATNVIIDTSLTFTEGQAYSLFLINRLTNISSLLVRDSLISPGPQKAAIRLIHLSPDASALEVTSGQGESPLVSNQSYKQASPFVLVDSGVQSLEIRSVGSTATVLSIPDVNLLSGGVYTIIAQGFVNPPAGNMHPLSARIILNN